MKNYKFLLQLALVFLLSGCAERSFRTIYPTLSDGRYDSEFPYRNCSKQLEIISKSINKIDCLVFYQTYKFKLEDRITVDKLSPETIENYAAKGDISTNSVLGTATTIYYDQERIAFLTCAHIVNFADTVYSFYENEEGARILHSIAVKIRQQNVIAGIPAIGSLDILAMDEELDIAILGTKTGSIDYPIPVFNYPLGKSEDLEWGSFVYVMGFPMGFQMITKGIISSPDRIKKGTILIDAVFNKGFSGGLVLAIKDGVPNFEVVGVARSASASTEKLIWPGKTLTETNTNPYIPYDGPVYLKSKEEINYGITYAIPIKSIQNFYKENENRLNQLGYRLNMFFNI